MALSSFFHKKYGSWNEIENDIEQIESSKTKGDVFEYFVFFYLNYFKDLYQIREIYCPVVDGRPFPTHIIEKLKLENTDFGVDGVYVSQQGEFVAWQAKFRSGRATPTYTELATFWAEAENANYRLIVANSLYLPKPAKKKEGHLSILFDHLAKLDQDFFSSLYNYYISGGKSAITVPKKKPYDFQETIINDIENGFASANKGKLIAACGIGKTLISLWVSERLGTRKMVFFAPSLQLIRQTLEKWTMESQNSFRYLCVCSDQTINLDMDVNTIEAEDLDVPVTTNSDVIANYLKSTNNELDVIFCTYQSSSVLHEAMKKAGFSGFDLAIYDEAHRTAGLSYSNLFSSAVSDEIIPAKRKLFMTATERLVRPRLSKQLQDEGREVFSMDDENFYGKVFHRLSFGEAISKNIISDYRIVFSGITAQELAPLIEKNLLVKDESNPNEIESIDNVYKRKILEKSISELGIQKTITFHSKINEAQRFATDLALKEIDGESKYIGHINGAMSAQRRANIIDNFESSGLGVLTNVRCLTEGIDIPLIDAVFFADPKGSLVDIVQAVGRAMRQPYGTKGKIAYIIIPLLVESINHDTLSGQGFEALFNLIQALRDQDDGLAEWIDTINLSAARGKSSAGSNGALGKLIINVPKEIEFDEFAESLVLRIAEVNKNPVGTTGIGSKLGKNERRGSFSRLFKTMCDYTPEKLEESLVRPTFEIINDPEKVYSGRELKINNNNVSHCYRLGLIKKLDNSFYQVTDIGKKYKADPESFNHIMKNQMLLFKYDLPEGSLYTYRLAFEFMKEMKQLNFVQFVYGLFSVQFDALGKLDLESAINIASLINSEFPNIELTNEVNKPSVLEHLNKYHPTGFDYPNVWTDRTTTGNQFRYLMRHLELFPDIFICEDNKLKVKAGAEDIIDELLIKTTTLIESPNYGYQWWL